MARAGAVVACWSEELNLIIGARGQAREEIIAVGISGCRLQNFTGIKEVAVIICVANQMDHCTSDTDLTRILNTVAVTVFPDAIAQRCGFNSDNNRLLCNIANILHAIAINIYKGRQHDRNITCGSATYYVALTVQYIFNTKHRGVTIVSMGKIDQCCDFGRVRGSDRGTG